MNRMRSVLLAISLTILVIALAATDIWRGHQTKVNATHPLVVGKLQIMLPANWAYGTLKISQVSGLMDFGSQIHTASNEKIATGTLFYLVAPDNVCRYGIELDSGNNSYFYDVSLDLSGNQGMSSSSINQVCDQLKSILEGARVAAS